MSTKKRKVGARKMWNHHFTGTINRKPGSSTDRPVFVLPATKEDYEAMVEQGALAIKKTEHGAHYFTNHDAARAVLAALNINPPKK